MAACQVQDHRRYGIGVDTIDLDAAEAGIIAPTIHLLHREGGTDDGARLASAQDPSTIAWYGQPLEVPRQADISLVDGRSAGRSATSRPGRVRAAPSAERTHSDPS